MWAVVRQTIAVVREKHVTADAAGLAYYAFNSLVPLAVLLYAAFTTFGTGDVVAHGLELVTGVAAADLEAAVGRVSGDGTGRVRAVALALVVTAWSAHRLFRGVDSLFDAVYGVRRERSRVRRFLDSTLVLATVTVGVGVVAGVGVALSLRVSGPVWLVLSPALLWLSLVALFAPMYVVLSGADVTVREVLPGAALTASVWTVSLGGFRLSLGRRRPSNCTVSPGR